MSLSGLFDIGKSALFASQTALNVVSNNIANVNTPGYSRHEAILEVANPVQVNGQFIGRGVGDVEVRRHFDKFIFLQIIGQNQSYGKSYSLERGLSHIEQIFNEAQNLGLGSSLKEYFNAWQEVAGNPDGEPQRTSLLHRTRALLQRSQQMEHDINNALKGINDDIGNAVNDINDITAMISSLNEKISQLEAGLTTEQASYFRDQRDSHLTALAEYMDYTWYEDKNGRVSIFAGGRTLVNEMAAYTLTTVVDLDGHRNVYAGQDDITSAISRGRLGGLLAVRGEIETNSLHDLRKLTASIIKETNMVHRTGYGLDGSTDRDFFSGLQVYTREYSSSGYVTSASVSDVTSLTLNEYDIQFDSAATYEVYNRQSGALVTSGAFTAGGTISFEGIDVVIDGAPAAGDSFLVSPLMGVIEDAAVAITDTNHIAAASSDLTLPGDNRKALEIVDLNQGSIADLGGGTFSEYYQGIVTDIGIMSRAASDSLTYDDNLRFELETKREAVSGVSLDEEAANLVRFQRMYEAAGRVLKVADDLMEMIINL
ncbi:MAG: flagellar hook-associated protein FlgK [Nitrospiraceae bacterium]|nr:MAG: flagellar hook-associated protein FlgK [Nitrospiraceae bacterium]